MDQVFNELSLSASLSTSQAARCALLDLVGAWQKLVDLGLTQNMRVTSDFSSREIMPGCSLFSFLKQLDSGRDKTLRQWLISCLSRSPYVERLYENEGIHPLEEYTCCGEICKGLTLAYLWGIPALSLSGDKRFTPPQVELAHNILEEDYGKIQEKTCAVGIVCRAEDTRIHAPTIAGLLRIQIRTGIELYEYVQQHLSSLVISTRAHEQLESMQQGYFGLSRIRAILEELQRAMLEAIENNTFFAPKGFRYTAAEGETATQGKNATAHTFTFRGVDSQGDVYAFLCESHMYITDGLRVYFHADRRRGKVYIGHIGEHLPGKHFG